ncbi:unnamed protein product [Echinostoma caproni]|uniref:Protein xylosyltransferase n=1 Tax=Echinostoma caproni TaxID=27848 RepID=A0A183AI75_9TREM|nr:unnamed protein product [Echinostoma caproni]
MQNLKPHHDKREVLCQNVISKHQDRNLTESLAKLPSTISNNLNFSDAIFCENFKKIDKDEPFVSEEETKFPLAFAFNIHREFVLFARLFRAVYRRHNSYCIHVDAKVDVEFRNQVTNLVKCFGENVHLIPLKSSILINWGDLGTIEAWFQCAKYFLRSFNVPWKYMLNVSGQEFPLRTNWELVKALMVINGSNVVEFDGIKAVRERVPKRRVSFRLRWLKGSVYTALRKEMVKFILTNKYATQILAALRTEGNQSKAQDELFFTTLNYNRQFKAPGGCFVLRQPKESDPRSIFVARYVQWAPPGQCSSKRSQRGVCIMGVRNVPELIRRPEFFVNKFRHDFEPVAYDCLEWWLLQKIKLERRKKRIASDFDPVFYKNLYCSKHHF